MTSAQSSPQRPGRFQVWMLAIRPKTLWAAVAPVLMGTAMAFGDGAHHWGAFSAALVGALLIQIGTNFANDYYDFHKGADDHDRLGPVRVTQAGLMRPEVVRTAFFVIFALAFLIGLYLVYRAGWPILLVGVLSILFGILYTGGPYPLGYNGLGDFFVLIFFGPVAVGGTYYVQALDINGLVLLAGLGPGLISTALLAINNLRDIDTDRRAGKRTLAVRFGREFAKLEYLFSIIVPCLLPALLAYLNRGNYFVLITVMVLLLAIPSFRIVMSDQRGPVLNQVLANTGKILLAYGVLFSLGWVL